VFVRPNELKIEYLGRVYPLSSEAKDFARAREGVFGDGDFSRTTVLDMRSLVHGNGRAYFVFYKHYYLQALHLCGRQEAPQLHEDMLRLGDRLMAEARAGRRRRQRRRRGHFRALLVQRRWAYRSSPRPPTRFHLRLGANDQVQRQQASRSRASLARLPQHHTQHHTNSAKHDQFPCPPTPALLGVRKNHGPYTIPPSQLRCTDRR
jgi:hypothetical protein